MESYISLLQNTRLFSGLSDKEIIGLMECLRCPHINYPHGGLVWRTGDKISRAGIVLCGSIQAETVTESGDLRIVASHGPGEIFGDVLMSAGESASPVDIVAARQTEILFIPIKGIMQSCFKCCPCHEKLRLNLLDEVARKYWDLNRRLKYLSETKLRRRIMLYLSDCAADAGANAFDVPFSRDKLAAYLCVNRSALSRELSRMRDGGLIIFSGCRFVLMHSSME
jgi:CRP-like cAMP-binding protein